MPSGPLHFFFFAGSVGVLSLPPPLDPPIPPKSDNRPLVAGDIVRLVTSGGGGFGPPSARPAEDQARDKAMGYVTG